MGSRATILRQDAAGLMRCYVMPTLRHALFTKGSNEARQTMEEATALARQRSHNSILICAFINDSGDLNRLQGIVKEQIWGMK